MKKILFVFGLLVLIGAGCSTGPNMAETSFGPSVTVPESWELLEDGGTQVQFAASDDVIVVMDINEATDRPIEGAETPIEGATGAKVYIRSCGSELPCYLVDLDGEYYKVWWSLEDANGGILAAADTNVTTQDIIAVMVTMSK